MAGAISSLYVELKLQADSFNNGLRDAQREAKEFEKVLKPSLAAAKELGTVMAAAGTAISAALVGMVKVAADYGDALRDASIRTGETTEKLAGLKLAAEQNGSSFEELQGGLKKFAVNVNAAADGTKKQADLFKTLGVNVLDATGHIRP